MFTKRFWQDAIERAAKTFFQAYAGAWVAVAAATGGALDFDSLFTADNVKAGIVGVAISFFMSMGSTLRGGSDNASLVQ